MTELELGISAERSIGEKFGLEDYLASAGCTPRALLRAGLVWRLKQIFLFAGQFLKM